MTYSGLREGLSPAVWGMVRVLNRAGLQELECRLEGNLARVQLKASGVKDVEVGYGRLLFRQGGKSWCWTGKRLTRLS